MVAALRVLRTSRGITHHWVPDKEKSRGGADGRGGVARLERLHTVRYGATPVHVGTRISANC
jgi:hypothetical protein